MLVNNEEPKNKSFSYSHPFASDFISGAAAGFFTGALVAPTEYTKVMLQTMPKSEWKSAFYNRDTYKTASKAILPFAMIFSSVCAIEFSVNKRISHSYGEVAAVTASAFTGALYLTAADHLLFRRQKGEQTIEAVRNLYNIRSTALWTGITPMVAREAIFITSVMHMGPALGRMLGNDADHKSIFWSSVGRLITGVSTTLLSQPFDVLAREMQLELVKNPAQRPTLLNTFKRVQQEYRSADKQVVTNHPLFRGAVPRMGLATVGGVLAGGFFDTFRDAIDTFEFAKIQENVSPLYSDALMPYNRNNKTKPKNQA